MKVAVQVLFSFSTALESGQISVSETGPSDTKPNEPGVPRNIQVILDLADSDRILRCLTTVLLKGVVRCSDSSRFEDLATEIA